MIGFPRKLRRLVPSKYSGPLVVEIAQFGVMIRPYRARKSSAVAMTWGAIYHEGAKRKAIELEREKKRKREEGRKR